MKHKYYYLLWTQRVCPLDSFWVHPTWGGYPSHHCEAQLRNAVGRYGLAVS